MKFVRGMSLAEIQGIADVLHQKSVALSAGKIVTSASFLRTDEPIVDRKPLDLAPPVSAAFKFIAKHETLFRIPIAKVAVDALGSRRFFAVKIADQFTILISHDHVITTIG